MSMRKVLIPILITTLLFCSCARKAEESDISEDVTSTVETTTETSTETTPVETREETSVSETTIPTTSETVVETTEVESVPARVMDCYSEVLAYEEQTDETLENFYNELSINNTAPTTMEFTVSFLSHFLVSHAKILGCYYGLRNLSRQFVLHLRQVRAHQRIIPYSRSLLIPYIIHCQEHYSEM